MHARESFLHHSDDRVDLLVQTWRVQSKGVPGGVGKSGRRTKLCLRRRQVVPYRHSHRNCEREGVVGGDEAHLGGVAQVIGHGVKVIGVHGEEGKEKDEEVRVEVKG